MGIKQAVVIVHGMGEQRPQDALNGFIKAALAPDGSGDPFFYSRPTRITDSYEARCYLAPRADRDGTERHAQTEFYEYHWAHLMQGNRLSDLWPTLKLMLLQPPNRVPSGLFGIWAVFWLLIGVTVWALAWGPLSEVSLSEKWVADALQTVLGAGVIAVAFTFVLTRLPKALPRFLTSSFVDVVRYLDTSPRSYEIRFNIRKGMVDLLQGLHDSGRYQRVVIVAHSLGAYIAYDGISYLWTRMNTYKPESQRGPGKPEGLEDVEAKAMQLMSPAGGDARSFQQDQLKLWKGIRARGYRWLITDFISVGTPMYFADRLYTRTKKKFDVRVKRLELPTCPPQSQDRESSVNVQTTPRYSYVYYDDRSLYHAAPFAVTRWTNMWFPTRALFFGDWFGGPLAPLFGKGILDIEIEGNRPWRWVPGIAHALYFKFGRNTRNNSVTTELRNSLDLASTQWLAPIVVPVDPPDPSSDPVT